MMKTSEETVLYIERKREENVLIIAICPTVDDFSARHDVEFLRVGASSGKHREYLFDEYLACVCY